MDKRMDGDWWRKEGEFWYRFSQEDYLEKIDKLYKVITEYEEKLKNYVEDENKNENI